MFENVKGSKKKKLNFVIEDNLKIGKMKSA